jgi:hypothetical protein
MNNSKGLDQLIVDPISLTPLTNLFLNLLCYNSKASCLYNLLLSQSFFKAFLASTLVTLEFATQ